MAPCAAVLASALAAYPAVRAGALAPLVAVLGGVAAVLSLSALLYRGRLAGPALFLLGAEYTIVEATGHIGVSSILPYSVGLVLLAELLFWAGPLSFDLRAEVPILGVLARRLATAGGLAAVLALLILAIARLNVPGVFAGAVLGSAAAVLIFGLVLLLVRRKS